MDLFDYVPPEPKKDDLLGMHRRADHETSVESARVVDGFRNALQAEIHAILLSGGPMTDGELEHLPQFAHYGPSTVRKRRSELFQDGRIYDTGTKRGRFKVWAAVKPEAQDE